MNRQKLLEQMLLKFGVSRVSDLAAIVGLDYSANAVDCDCYAPIWMHPYTRLGFSVPTSGKGMVFNFYTDKPSEFGYSENSIAYCWLVQARHTVDWSSIQSMFEFMADWYMEDTNKPEAITWIPERYVKCFSSPKLQFVPCLSEYVYETDRMIAYDAPNVRSRNRSGARRYSRDPIYSTIELRSFIKTFPNKLLVDFLFDWYNTKENIEGYPNYECMSLTLESLEELLGLVDLDVAGLVVLCNGKIIGLSFCSRLNSDSWAFLGRFTNSEYPYISDYLMYKTAELYRKYPYCHDGGAGGRAGLAEFKQRLLTDASMKHTEQYYAVLPSSLTVDPAKYATAGIHF